MIHNQKTMQFCATFCFGVFVGGEGGKEGGGGRGGVNLMIGIEA